MPKTPARDDYFAKSFRFAPEQAATTHVAAVLKYFWAYSSRSQRLGHTAKTTGVMPRVELMNGSRSNFKTGPEGSRQRPKSKTWRRRVGS